MTVWLHLMILITTWEGLFSQSVVLTQLGSELKRPGESVRLKCATSGFVLNDWYMGWIRQKPGKGLEWLVYYWKPSQTNYYLPAIQGRFTASKDTSNFYLQMNNLTPEDTAVYYCARNYYSSGNYFDYWGPGTMVTVTEATTTAPTVFPLPPCSQGSSTPSQVSIGCLVTGYFPEPVTVQWNSGAITQGIRTFPAVLDSSRSRYTLSSQLTIPTSSWESQTFQCNVAHTASRSTISKDIQRPVPKTPVAPEVPKLPVAPEVRVLHSSCKSRSRDATIELLCIISSFYPPPVTVKWLVGGQAGQLVALTEEPTKDAHGYTFSTTSAVNVSQADWQSGSIYSCEVFHEATQTKVKSSAKICEDATACPSTGIDVKIIPPTPKDLYINNYPKLTCKVENMVDAEGLKISWSWESSGTVNALNSPLEVKEEPNGRFTATKAVTASTWLQGDEFTCKVEYPGLASPIIRTVAKVTGTSRAPEVYLYRPHSEEIRSQSAMLTLTCLVTGFTPEAISVQWLKNHNAVSEDHHANTPVMKDNNNHSYFMYSHMKIPKADWNTGNAYTCMVIHEALPMKFTQRTVEKSQAKK